MMLIKINVGIGLFFLISLSCLQIQADTLFDRWQDLEQQGSHEKFDGQYGKALKSFESALKLARDPQLPNKCLPITLCRVADVEVITNKIDEADKLIPEIVQLIKTQRQEHNLDPQVSFWAAVLSDSYLGNTKPDNREKCLKRACYLKEIIYGDSHHECTDCLNRLAGYYIDQNKLDKAMRILDLRHKIMEKQFGKSPDEIGNILHAKALEFRREHKFKQADELELEVITLAKKGEGYLKDSIPAFYCFLAINAIAQGNSFNQQTYFNQACNEATKIKELSKKNHCRHSFDALVNLIVTDIDHGKYSLAGSELNKLIEVKKLFLIGEDDLYQPYARLAAVLDYQHQFKDGKKYLVDCIKIAETKNSRFQNELPDLYLRLGLTQLNLGDIDQANKSFIHAISLEKNKNGHHAGTVYLFWGWRLAKLGKLNESRDKIDTALQIGLALPPEKRGTVVLDAYLIMAKLYEAQGLFKEAKRLEARFADEEKVQKKIGNNLGPGLHFHQVI